MNFISNSKMQVLFILLNLIIYTVIYFITLKYKYKIKMKKKIALIFGVTGQDGSYLAIIIN